MSIVNKIVGEFVETEIDGELILMHIDTGSFFSMESTGHKVWKLLDKYENTDDIIKYILDHYGASKDNCADEVENFILDLDNAGFVVIK